jgi:FkbM family methyltransferase
MLEIQGRKWTIAARGSQSQRAGKLLRILARPAHWRGLRHGVAASVEHEGVLARLNPRIIVDVGANRGQFALAARRAVPQARIISFEPLPGPAAVFRRLFARERQVQLFEAALSPARARLPMHVSRRDDSSSLLPIGPAQTALFAGTEEAGICFVETGPLEDFVAAPGIVAPALLKLDVQGYELEALKACGALLRRFAHIYAEASFVTLYEGQALAPEIIAFLAGHGFGLAGFYNTVCTAAGEPVQADFLFRNGA